MKRQSSDVGDVDDVDDVGAVEPERTRKRARLAESQQQAKPGHDLLSPLSDELLVRILSFLPVQHLVFSVAPLSRRFHRLAGDSQLWKALYYSRFVLPRAMRIPGFREDPGLRGLGQGHKLHYSGRRRIWADGRRGGLVRDRHSGANRLGLEEYGEDEDEGERLDEERTTVNWKRQYKIRHNWARGKCAVEELRIAEGEAEQGRKVLVKVVEGVAITADATLGLRAWDLKTRATFARISLHQDKSDGPPASAPTCIAVDEGDSSNDTSVSMAVGFLDGSFGVWRLDLRKRQFEPRYRHRASSNGELIGVALSYPYLLTATRSVLISMYTFSVPSQGLAGGSSHATVRLDEGCKGPNTAKRTANLPSPYLLTSLKSHSSRAPIALSIRSTPSSTIASIAYTFTTYNGWSIGMQDLHISSGHGKAVHSVPEITTTRLAYTASVDAGSASFPQTPTTPSPRRGQPSASASPLQYSPGDSSSTPSSPPSSTDPEPGPTTLCYTHPYLLAALPDNTLILYLVTSTVETLSLSPGIRLWGHTSGISDAEITSRGKAVSVSERGNEMRVWELEGGSAWRHGGGKGKSIEIRADGPEPSDEGYEWDGKRNWVGFDDEMVIVLKEGRSGKESLMVYDFT